MVQISPEYPHSDVQPGIETGQYKEYLILCRRNHQPCNNGKGISGNLSKVPERFAQPRFADCKVCEDANTPASVTKILPGS